MKDRREFLNSLVLGGAFSLAGSKSFANEKEKKLNGKFSNKTVFITGAARGIGRQTARKFAQEGANIVMFDLGGGKKVHTVTGYEMSTTADFEEAYQEISQLSSGKTLKIVGDVRSRSDLALAYEQTIKKFGNLEVVVCCAGIMVIGEHSQTKAQEWQEVLDINLVGVSNTVYAATPHLVNNKKGKIVIVSSMLGRSSNFYSPIYIASKWGVTGLMKSLAIELGKDNINVNAVAPSGVNTPLLKMEKGNKFFFEGVSKFLKSKHKLNVPILETEDVANSIVFLSGPEADCISGITLDVSAGWTAEGLG